MQQVTENIIYQRATKCWECVNRAMEILGNLLKKEEDFSLPDFYKSKDLLREAEAFFKDALKNAKKLLGPTPDYVSEDYQKWRDELLEEFQILAMSHEYEELKSELFEDDFLRGWMDEAGIESLLKKHFQTQQSGKRKLPNIKVRIILDKLEELISTAKKMNYQAAQRQHS